MPRKPSTLRPGRNLCILTECDSRDVQVSLKRASAKGDSGLKLVFRRKYTRRTVEVNLADIYRAKVGNVELSQALNGVELHAKELATPARRRWIT